MPGFEGMRFFADAPSGALRDIRSTIIPRPKGSRTQCFALSGGGAAGAFGAGLLCGWTERGDRPKFDLVTGVSAGALIAPFAFLGPEGDERLTHLFTSGVAESLHSRGARVLSLLSPWLVGEGPLRALVADHIDEGFVRRLAERHRDRGRLLVVTTDLDAQRSTVWNIGAIAATGRPDALPLIRSVLVASASIPAVFPAVPIEVEANGERFTELHSDGGVTRQVFVVPDAMVVDGQMPERVRALRPELTVIVNNELDAHYERLPNRALPVAMRAYATLIKAGTQTTLHAVHAFARTHELGFRLAFVDRAVPWDRRNPFDTGYMRTLYAMGKRKGLGGEWHKVPPVGRPYLAASLAA